MKCRPFILHNQSHAGNTQAPFLCENQKCGTQGARPPTPQVFARRQGHCPNAPPDPKTFTSHPFFLKVVDWEDWDFDMSLREFQARASAHLHEPARPRLAQASRGHIIGYHRSASYKYHAHINIAYLFTGSRHLVQWMIVNEVQSYFGIFVNQSCVRACLRACLRACVYACMCVYV